MHLENKWIHRNEDDGIDEMINAKPFDIHLVRDVRCVKSGIYAEKQIGSNHCR